LTEGRSPPRTLAPDTVGSEARKPTSLRGRADKAKADKQHRFRDLYRCLNVALLLACWGDLNQDAASGADGVTWHTYAEHLQANVEAWVERLKQKRYRAKLIRRRYIPKGNGQERPLGIPVIEDKLLQAACARILNAIYAQEFLACSDGYRPERGAGEAVRDLTFDRQYGRYGYVVEADIQGFFDHMDHDWLLEMLRLRIDDRAFLGLIRKWLKAGILETDGRVIHPDTGVPQGGVVSPVVANVYLHYALDLWVETVVKPHGRGEALISRYADDFVCAFRFRSDAEWFYEVLPKRLGKFTLEVSPEKTRILRFSRFHPGMTRRFTFLGFEFFWKEDRQGVPRVKHRTARQKLQRACKRIKEWIQANRHAPGQAFFNGLNARLRGHYRDYGVHGNAGALSRFFDWARPCAFKWLNRRGGKRRSFSWARFTQILDANHIERPRITEVRRRRVFA
jgi:group II intron reverse transcriptase/maturase